MVKKNVRVVFFIPWLGGGGAERTFLNILNSLDLNRFNPVLVLCRKRGTYLDILKKNIKVVCLDCSLKFALIPLAIKIKKLDPDVIISTMRFSNLVAVLAAKLAGGGRKVVVRETNNLTAAGIDSKNIMERMVGWSYRAAAKVVSLSDGVKNDIVKRYGIEPDHVVRIYNPIDFDNIVELATQKKDGKPIEMPEKRFNLITVGKLHPQKGLDLLIQAIAELDGLSLYLTILGEGQERQRLSDLIKVLGLEKKVCLLGFKKNPYSYIAGSDLFVLPSRWEGFGHVIVEAMACRVPVLSTNCPSGPNEIITDGIDGCLCLPDSVKDLAVKIKILLENEDLRKKYVRNASTSINRFDQKMIVRQYEELFIVLSHLE